MVVGMSVGIGVRVEGVRAEPLWQQKPRQENRHKQEDELCDRDRGNNNEAGEK